MFVKYIVFILFYINCIAGTDGSCRDETPEFKYYPRLKGCLKLHIQPTDWQTARKNCLAEGGRLASAWTDDFVDSIIILQIRTYQLLPMLFSGARPRQPPLNGEATPSLARELCGAFFANGTTREVSCEQQLPYVCYAHESASVCLGSRGKPGYEYHAQIHGWLKLHQEPATWLDARVSCHLEGAFLASAWSDEFSAAIKAIQSSPSGADQTIEPIPALYSGEHKTFAEGAYTYVKGEPAISLESSDLAKLEHCSVFYADGSMGEVDCKKPLPYVCYAPAPAVAPEPVPTLALTSAAIPTPTRSPTTAPTSATTPAPTPYPTSSDTTDPTSSDTTDPTSSDTTDPTSSDTTDPTSSDTTDPTSSDTTDPTPSLEYKWIPTTPDQAISLKDRAVIGGFENDGRTLWVIRAWFEGNLVPGKFNNYSKKAYIPWGKEQQVKQIEVLCARPETFRWEKSSGGAIPANAFVAGNTTSGDLLYVGRAMHKKSLIPGQMRPKSGNSYVSFDGKVFTYNNYETLTSFSPSDTTDPTPSDTTDPTPSFSPSDTTDPTSSDTTDPTSSDTTDPTPSLEYKWIPTTPDQAISLKDRAVIGGFENDGRTLWVIRAWFEGNLVPGKFNNDSKKAYIPWGKEQQVKQIEVLCARPETFRWEKSSGGAIPANAFVAGNTTSGDLLYVGRAMHKKSLIPGQMRPKSGNSYVSFDGKVFTYNNYETLTSFSPSDTTDPTPSFLPSDTTDPTPSFSPSDTTDPTPSDTTDPTPSFSPSDTTDPTSSDTTDPTSSDTTDPTPSLEYKWIPTTPDQAISLKDRAVIGGFENDGRTLWVIRAWFEGNLVPGKFNNDSKKAYIPWGKEQQVKQIEVLCARPETFRWEKSSGGAIPANAFVAGNTTSGDLLNVGRAMHKKSLIPGQVRPKSGNSYVSFDGKVFTYNNYEILTIKL